MGITGRCYGIVAKIRIAVAAGVVMVMMMKIIAAIAIPVFGKKWDLGCVRHRLNTFSVAAAILTMRYGFRQCDSELFLTVPEAQM